MRKVIVLISFLVFALSLANAQYYNPISAASQSASVWQSILNFLGLSDAGNENTQNNSIETSQILNTSDVIESVDSTLTDQTQVLSDNQFDNNFSNNIDGSYIKCIPAAAKESEPALVVFSCPSSYELVDNNLNVSTDYGIINVSVENKTYYIDCKSGDYVERYECSFKAFSPAILQFYIEPSNPNLDELVKVTYETRDTRQCKLFVNANLVKNDLSGSYTFKYKGDTNIKLICEGNDGFLLTKDLKI